MDETGQSEINILKYHWLCWRMRMQLMLDPFFPAWDQVPRSATKSEEGQNRTRNELIPSDYVRSMWNFDTFHHVRDTWPWFCHARRSGWPFEEKLCFALWTPFCSISLDLLCLLGVHCTVSDKGRKWLETAFYAFPSSGIDHEQTTLFFMRTSNFGLSVNVLKYFEDFCFKCSCGKGSYERRVIFDMKLWVNGRVLHSNSARFLLSYLSSLTKFRCVSTKTEKMR